MTQRTVRSEIESKIIAWAATKSPAIKLALENVPFTKPETTFIEVYIIPATTVNPNIDGVRTTLYGIIQFNIYSKQAVGTKESEDLAQELIDLFPVVPKTGTVSIEQTGSILNPMYDAQWRMLPVRIRYRQENY